MTGRFAVTSGCRAAARGAWNRGRPCHAVPLGPAFTLLAVEAAGPCRHTAGVRWFVDETYVKVAGVWRPVYRAVDEHGQVIDILVSARRDIAAARRFFVRMLAVQEDPEEVTTDRAPTLAAVIAELLPAAVHVTEQHPNDRMECDHGRPKARLQAMRGPKTFRSARTSEGMPSSRTLRRGHYELGPEARHSRLRVVAAIGQLARAIWPSRVDQQFTGATRPSNATGVSVTSGPASPRGPSASVPELPRLPRAHQDGHQAYRCDGAAGLDSRGKSRSRPSSTGAGGPNSTPRPESATSSWSARRLGAKRSDPLLVRRPGGISNMSKGGHVDRNRRLLDTGESRFGADEMGDNIVHRPSGERGQRRPIRGI